jgi:hypothetical protein
MLRQGEANGDTIVDFVGNGALAGDQLLFVGYGLAPTFVNVDATHWRVSSAGGTFSEVIAFANAATIDATDSRSSEVHVQNLHLRPPLGT